jgi:hypothetical protein
MAGVHGLQHVEGLAAADLSNDDAVRSHPQRIPHQIAHGDLAPAFDVRRARFEPHHVRLPEPELGGVLDRDEAFAIRDEAREHVEERGLPGTRAARDHDVGATADTLSEEACHAW